MKALPTTLLLGLVLAHCVLGQEDGKIRIDRLEAAAQDSQLILSAQFVNLFSRRIVGTIQSGLSSVIQVEIDLIEDNDRQVFRTQWTRTLSYDIWEERYLVKERDTTAIYTDFAQARQKSSRLDSLVLMIGASLKSNATYQVKLRVGIIPISATQGGKVSDWLTDPNQTEERLASEDRSSGFKFTLNNLVSFFVGDNKSSKYVSDWHLSQPFKAGRGQ